MSPPQFRHLATQVQQGVLILTISETAIHEEDLAESLRLELCAAVPGPQVPPVAVDFQKVKYLSTPCLRSLLAFRRHIRERNGRLLLCGMSEVVADVFFSTNLGSTTESSIIPFALAADVPAAVAYLSKATP